MSDPSVSPADTPEGRSVGRLRAIASRKSHGVLTSSEAAALLAAGERDRQRIRELTEGLGRIKNKMMAQPYGASPEACAVADWVEAEVDAVLAGEEVAP